MRYTASYRIPDLDDRGSDDKCCFLLVNSAGYYEFDEPFGATHRKQGRRDFYLSYNRLGRMKAKVCGRMQPIGPGDAFIYSPMQEQYYGQEDAAPFQNYWVHFTGYGAYEMLSGAGLIDQPLCSAGDSPELVELFERIIDELQQKRTGYELVSASLLMHAVGELARLADRDERNRRKGAGGIVESSLKYIHRNIDKPVSIAELADLSHLSTNRYSRLFKEHVGLPPRGYITDLRLNKACEMMRRTSLNIRQIAVLSGFEDQLYFSRLFRKRFGITPSGYARGVRQPKDGG